MYEKSVSIVIECCKKILNSAYSQRARSVLSILCIIEDKVTAEETTKSLRSIDAGLYLYPLSYHLLFFLS